MQSQQEEGVVQFEDGIIDWLVDDPRHVLIRRPHYDASSVVKLDIYSGSIVSVIADRENVGEWLSDGRGSPRLYQYYDGKIEKWYYRLSDNNGWNLLHKSKVGDNDSFEPVGFGDSPDQLMIMKPDGEHQALWSVDLKNDLAEKLIYSRPDADLGSVMQLGKFRRMVAVSYATDVNHLYFFDPELEKISDRFTSVFSNKQVAVMDESWDKSVYLVNIDSPRDPGRNFFYFAGENRLKLISFSNPLLMGYELSEMKPIDYSAADGVRIPGYLTLPQGKPAKMLPTVILPHGGPHSRDYQGFDWLPQYLAAKGYAVLQSNYRGSGGMGGEWMGEGGYKAWRQVISDLTDGTHWLVKQGIADPNRICVVGWSYGGYAALMSAIEHSDLYRCVVSIAGVTDPQTLIRDRENFLNKRAERAFIGTEDEVLKNGSPLRRVAEIKAPVLMFHGERDVNVPVRHSELMDKALKKAGKSSEFIFYKGTDHHIERNAYRIDMLTRIGAFLEKNMGQTAPDVAAR
jgi:dipeptidyl aminopeptidase/acylaminoacyl peptidase